MNINDSEQIDELCLSTLYLSSQSGFGVLLWLAILFSLVAIILNIFFARVIWRFTVYHINLRLLLVNTCALIVWISLMRLIRSAYIFFSLYTSSDPCSYLVIAIPSCETISNLSVILPSATLSLGALGMGLERMYGLIRYNAYHKKAKNSLWLSFIILIFFVWGPSILSQIYARSYLKNDTAPWVTMPLCLNPAGFHYRDWSYILFAFTVAQLLSALIWILVYCTSRHLLIKISINRAQQSLAERFQLSQNFGVVRTLSPWVVFHVLFHSAIFSLLLATDQKQVRLDFLSRVCLIYAVYFIQLMYAVCFPALCVAKSIVLRRRLLKMVGSMKLLIGLGHEVNAVRPEIALHVVDAVKEAPTSNGFQLAEFRSINTRTEFSSSDKVGFKKQLRRIHVFSTLE